MNATDLIGYAAACLTTFSFVPQALHTFRTRDVSGISLGMYSVFTLGVFFWLLYGLVLQAWPVVAANAVTLALACAILVMKLRYGARGKTAP
jgi:MtN3 and saliva related transmembrane protein